MSDDVADTIAEVKDAAPAAIPEQKKRKAGRPKGVKDRQPRAVFIEPAHRAIVEHMTTTGSGITAAMIAQSYSPASANIQSVTKTRSWAQLMEEYLPEDKLAQRHMELLDKRDIRLVGRGKRTQVIDEGPNVPAVKAALEMGYKLRGSFKSEAPPPQGAVVYNLFYQPQIQARVKAFEDAIKEQITYGVGILDEGEGNSDGGSEAGARDNGGASEATNPGDTSAVSGSAGPASE